MILSLNSDTFAALKSDFDTVLARTIGNMTMKGASDAVLTLKLGVSLENSAVSTPDGIREITKPSFSHTISSVMQIRDKMTGQFKGEYGMVWDEDNQIWVLRKIDNGQMTMFDDDAGIRFLDMPDEDVETADEVKEVPETPFSWLCQFIGESLHVTEAMGNFTVRTEDNKVVLSSATSPDSPFYCPAEKLEAHVGHEIVCAGYGPDEIVNVAIECEDCHQVLFDLDIPDYPPEDEDEELVSEALDAAADIVEAIDAEEEGDEEDYEYESPEDEE